jgi:hypothetical protein
MATPFSPWARIGVTPRAFPTSAILTALSRAPGRVEIFGAATDGGIWVAGYDEASQGSGFRDWTRIGSAPATNTPPNLGPLAVTRGEVVDVLTIAADGTLWTTTGTPDHGWAEYRLVGRDAHFVPGTALTAYASDENHLRLFALGRDGQVWNAGWSSSSDWGDWVGIGPESLLATRRHHMLDVGRRARIAALNAGGAGGRTDVFAVDRGGRARTVARVDGKWGFWSTIGEEGLLERESQISALALDADTVLLVAPGRDGAVWWTRGRPARGEYAEWARIGDHGLLGEAPRTRVAALSRRPGEVDLFVAGADGSVYTTSGSPEHGLPPFEPALGLGAPVAAHAVLAVTSSRPDRIDLFAVRADGLAYAAFRREGARASLNPPAPATLRTPASGPAAGNDTVVILGAGARDAGAGPDVLTELAELDAVRATSESVAKRHALLVGVNAYVDPNLPPLRYCESDALALSETLTAAGYDSIVTLHDGAAEPRLRPTRENIKVELLTLCEQLAPDDLLLVHFSCHGTLIGGKPHLLPANARTKILAETALAVDEVTRIVAASAARCAVVLLDACHTGADFGRDAGPPSLTPEFVHNVYELAQGMKVLAGATSQQVAREREDQRRGAFTSFVIEALTRVDGFSPADHEKKGFVSFDDLKNHVAAGVMEWSRKHSLDLQRPNETGYAAGSMIIADFRQAR